MTRVTVLFADGSKSLAHNLDDRRERWELRRELEPEMIVGEIAAGYAVPFVDETTSYDDLVQVCAAYGSVLSGIRNRLRLMGKSRFLKAYDDLSAIYQEALGLDLAAKTYLRAKRVEIANSETREALNTLKAYTRELEQIILDERLTLPEPPFPTWLNVEQLAARKRMNEEKAS